MSDDFTANDLDFFDLDDFGLSELVANCCSCIRHTRALTKLPKHRPKIINTNIAMVVQSLYMILVMQHSFIDYRYLANHDPRTTH